jgi:glutathione S-transferase
MKLYYSPASPYVRKVRVIAHETGQSDDIELLDCAPSPVKRDTSITPHNPTGKIPTLVLDDGTELYDSRVITQYLDSRHGGPKLYPDAGPQRWTVLRREALADGLLDAALLARYETVLRPTELQWTDWRQAQMEKIDASMDKLNEEIQGAEGIDAGVIACACALGYIDFRFQDHEWRSTRAALADWFAAFSKRASMLATRPDA